MDKTLEVVLVATVLVVASVVVISMLQSQSNSFNQFAGEQESSASCGIAESKIQRQCPDKTAVTNIKTDNPSCSFASESCKDLCDVSSCS